MTRGIAGWIKVVAALGLVGGIVAGVTVYNVTKTKAHSLALIQEVVSCYDETFANYRYCVRPMFAANYKASLKLWRGENRRLGRLLDRAMYRYDSAEEELTWTVQALRDALAGVVLASSFDPYSESRRLEDRKRLAAALERLDDSYGEFSRIAGGLGGLAPRTCYVPEYR